LRSDGGEAGVKKWKVFTKFGGAARADLVSLIEWKQKQTFSLNKNQKDRSLL